MKSVVKLVPFEALMVVDNVRLERNLHSPELAADIEANGLRKPIEVWRPNGNKDLFETLCGHRRLDGIKSIRQSNPARFDELFGKGVPVLVHTDISLAEAIGIKVDHGNEVPLSDNFEVQLCCNLLFSAGKAEADVAVTLAGLLDRINPMSTKNRKAHDLILATIKEQEAAGNSTAVGVEKAKLRQFIADLRRGSIQNYHTAYRCPRIVMAALASKAGAKVSDLFKDAYLPALTTKDVAALWKAHKDDLGELEGGLPKYNDITVGPKFSAVWSKLVQDDKDAAAAGPKAAAPKSMAANAIMKEVTTSVYKSTLAIAMAHHCAGSKEFDERLPVLDLEAYAIDLIKAYNKSMWAEVQEAVQLIEKMLVENASKVMTATELVKE